ncbi:AAA family ATPase [uncultured Phenylobacterium sp.]|uniref:AAA family ATPase n=1 Tax=uncultured Phenylobacterium sp. TaxID=349273 RepID=UPI0025FA2537|nr:AAA family ATPase [uncultured Phenylobacterium sp.]
MRITRVAIKRWRSIKDLQFYPDDITVLVGPNNAGKTNILSAINFLLGDRWPMPANLEDSDFYAGDRTRDIEIRLELADAPISCIDFNTGRGWPLEVYDNNGIQVRGFNNDQRSKLAFAYVDAGRNFDRQFGMSRWSLFGQAVRRLHDDLKGAGEGGPMAQLRVVLDQAHGLLRTDLYQEFETNIREAFAAQLRTAKFDVAFEFRTLDETNLYRGLYPTLIERGRAKSPAEVGSGVRNLLVLALFQAFAKSFRGGAVLGIEEPELYLHPHAQRSLMAQFEILAGQGNQIFVSTHSAAFLDVTRSERIVIVDRCADEEEEVCTQARITSAPALLHARQQLHPLQAMTDASRRAFLRSVRTNEMAEAFFARVVLVVEGASEREALPILLRAAGLNLDEEGISIVVAGGKSPIDTVAQLYMAHRIPVFVIFDNDASKPPADRASNRTVCRLLGIPETDLPAAQVGDKFAILSEDWESQMDRDLAEWPGWYAAQVQAARDALNIAPGRNKPLVARYVAETIAALPYVPNFVGQIAASLRKILGELDP